MSEEKPRIAVTGPNSGGFTAWVFTAFNVYLAGGIPTRVTPDSFSNNISYDGIIIGGGSDVHPDNMQEQPLRKSKRSSATKIKEALLYPMEFISRFGKHSYDKERDDLEILFIEYALKNDKPLLGICRGHQLLNASLGGTMYTSTLPLLKNKPRIRSPFPRKKVIYVKSDSLISEIAGNDPIKVNAIHSQAVAAPGEHLEVTAKEKAGVNQVIESDESDKLLGVQWHPEYLFYMKIHRNIFRWLIKEAKS